MSDDLVKMARAAFHDDRLATGQLYGDLAARIEALEAELAAERTRAGEVVRAANHVALNYLLDEHDDPDLCVNEEHWSAINDLFCALAAYEATP